MSFWTLKDQTTFRELLSLAGYGLKQQPNGTYTVLSVHEMMQVFADDMGISIRTAQRYYKENDAPKVYRKLLLVMSGYLGEINPVWDKWGINRNSGELFTSELAKITFRPNDLINAYWHKQNANNYHRMTNTLDNERAKLKNLQKKELGKYLEEIENAAANAARDAIKLILDMNEPSIEEPEENHTINLANFDFKKGAN